MKITRRDAIGIMAATAAFEPQVVAQQAGEVSINWLDKATPGMEVGVSFGVPWARGTVNRGQIFVLSANFGQLLPVQAWPLAYWPDGSVKFTGFATVTDASGPFRLGPGTISTNPTVKVTESARAIDIDTGKLQGRRPN